MNMAFHEVVKHSHLAVQNFFLGIQNPFQPLVNKFFKFYGVKRFFIIRAPITGEYSNIEFLDQVISVIKDAVEIKIAFGDLEHLLIDRREIISALEYSYKNNNCQIEIVYGPRRDPATSRILPLIHRGIITLYNLSYYQKKNYILTKSTGGEYNIIDEGSRNETLWVDNEKGSPTILYTSRYRIYYVTHDSKFLAQKRLKNFNKIKNIAEKVENADEFNYINDKPFPIISTILNGFLNIPSRWIFQPLEIILDKNNNIGYFILKYFSFEQIGNSMRNTPENVVNAFRPNKDKVNTHRPIFLLLHEIDLDYNMLDILDDLYTAIYAHVMLYVPETEYVKNVPEESAEEINRSIERVVEKINNKEHQGIVLDEFEWVKRQIKAKRFNLVKDYVDKVSTQIDAQLDATAFRISGNLNPQILGEPTDHPRFKT